MIDWDKPIGLSNGREAVVLEIGSKTVRVKIRGAFEPAEEAYHDPSEWMAWNYTKDGRWVGANDTTYHIINLNREEEMICEDWS